MSGQTWSALQGGCCLFRSAYGITPSEYRRNPVPVVLRTALRPFDCYLLGIGGTGMAESIENVKTYFVTMPAHKFMHIRNYESIGYHNFIVTYVI